MAVTEAAATTTNNNNVAAGARIVKVVARHLKMNLPKPYKMTTGIMYHADTVLVEIYVQVPAAADDVGGGGGVVTVVGYGEGAPYHSPTAHELPNDILNYVQNVVGPKMLDQHPIDLLMNQKFTTNPDVNHIVAMGAIDIALWDVRGKLENQPICNLLGRVRAKADVLWPVSSDNSLEDDINALQTKINNGYHTFMVKCGSHNVQTDIDRVCGLLRHQFDTSNGKPIELIPDANQGWTFEQATQFVKAIMSSQSSSSSSNNNTIVSFLEQPCHRDGPKIIEEMKQLYKIGGNQLIFSADESIRSPEDIESICTNKHYQVASIKVCKVGGITGAQQACKTLANAGIELYFNSMIEGSCAQAALLHVYCATPKGVMTHLGHAFMSVLRLEEYADFINCLSDDRSTISVPLDKPGLGLQINPTKVEEQTSSKIEVVSANVVSSA